MKKRCLILLTYVVLIRLIEGFFICKFYHKMLGEVVLSKYWLFGIAVGYGLHFNFTLNVIPEPLRMLGGSSILVAYILVLKIKISILALMLSVFTTFVVRILIILFVGALTYLFGIENAMIFNVVFYSPTAIILFFEIERKLKNCTQLLKSIDVKIIIYSLFAVVLTVYGYVRVQMYNLGPITLITLIGVILISISFLSYALWMNLNKRRADTEKKELLRLKDELLDRSENLESTVSKLEKENQEMVSKWHSIKEVVRANDLAFMKLESEISKGLGSEGTMQRIKRMSMYNKELKVEISFEKSAEELDILNIPADWERLALSIVGVTAKAKSENIHFSVDNKIEKWNEIEISENNLIKLLGNLLSNGIKELKKSDIERRTLRLSLHQEEGVFAIEVFDNAHEFSIDVLRKLGERGNSTNGTGDGFYEIFEILKNHHASFEIKEIIDMKRIQILFDGQSEYSIYSSYRVDVLCNELLGGNIEIT